MEKTLHTFPTIFFFLLQTYGGWKKPAVDRKLVNWDANLVSQNLPQQKYKYIYFLSTVNYSVGQKCIKCEGSDPILASFIWTKKCIL